MQYAVHGGGATPQKSYALLENYKKVTHQYKLQYRPNCYVRIEKYINGIT